MRDGDDSSSQTERVLISTFLPSCLNPNKEEDNHTRNWKRWERRGGGMLRSGERATYGFDRDSVDEQVASK